MRLLQKYKKYKQKKIKFDKSKNYNCWLDLAENEVVMNHLRSRLEMNQHAVEALILQNRDKKDIKKATLLGGIKEVIQIIDKAEQAQNLKRKYGTRT